jgi:hypothetical protein
MVPLEQLHWRQCRLEWPETVIRVTRDMPNQPAICEILVCEILARRLMPSPPAASQVTKVWPFVMRREFGPIVAISTMGGSSR